jgi:hypothetical protein
MPNYTAKQFIQRRSKPTERGRYTLGMQTQIQTAEEQISYVDRQELHKVLRVNGIEVRDGNDQSGMYSRGEFALLLGMMFRPETKATFRWNRFAKLDGRRMSVYDFSVPQLPNGYGLMEGARTLLVPFKGSFFADAETNAVMRIQFTCTDIPSVSNYTQVELTLDYKPIKVAGQEYILPSRYTMNSKTKDADILMESNYRNYQRFAADATIIFEEEPAPR